jgi:hypothetical protein
MGKRVVWLKSSQWKIAGVITRRRFGNRRYSRFGNPRYKISDGQLPALSPALVVTIQMFSTKQMGRISTWVHHPKAPEVRRTPERWREL